MPEDIVSDDITADTSGIPKYDPDEDYNADEYDLDDMYDYVLHGYAGSGDYRKDYLDTDYTAVQNKINEILKNPRSVTQYALDVINGE